MCSKGRKEEKEDTPSVNKREREKWLMSILMVVVERVPTEESRITQKITVRFTF